MRPVPRYPLSPIHLGNWIESGITIGVHQSGTGKSLIPTFYWADYRPGLGYTEHYGSAASLNTYHPFRVYKRAQAGEWDVRAGPYTGTSRNNTSTNQLISSPPGWKSSVGVDRRLAVPRSLNTGPSRMSMSRDGRAERPTAPRRRRKALVCMLLGLKNQDGSRLDSVRDVKSSLTRLA